MVIKLSVINGGFFQSTKDKQVPSVVIAVDDIYRAMKDIAAAGGKVLAGQFKPAEPDDIQVLGCTPHL